MAEREIVSAGRIQFDEDGEPVGFEEQKFRRDGASIAPLTPGEGPPADGASEERPGEQEPAPAAGEGGGPTARQLSDLLSDLDTFEKHRPRDWLGFLVTGAEEAAFFQFGVEASSRREPEALVANEVVALCAVAAPGANN